MYQMPDFTKMFDPQNMSQAMSTMMNMQQFATTTQSQMQAYQQLSSIWSETFQSLAQTQTKMAQEAMEETVQTMKELSSSQGIEDLMSKQSTWSQKTAETCQKNAQELAKVIQKGQTQCSDIMASMMQQNFKQAAKASKQ